MDEENSIVEIAPDIAALNHLAATWFVETVNRSLAEQSNFHVALSGGSTPKALYALLADDVFRDQVNWQRVHVYFGDERCVPHDHQDSNYLMASQALLSKIPIPQQNVHPVPIYFDSLDKGAQEYSELIANKIEARYKNIPAFDLIWLGMGDDGHTASLFPETTILNQQQKWIDTVYVQKLQAWRISFTFPLINAAKCVAFLVAGKNKAEKIHAVLQARKMQYPIERVKPQGKLWWFLDDAAAELLI